MDFVGTITAGSTLFWEYLDTTGDWIIENAQQAGEYIINTSVAAGKYTITAIDNALGVLTKNTLRVACAKSGGGGASSVWYVNEPTEDVPPSIAPLLITNPVIIEPGFQLHGNDVVVLDDLEWPQCDGTPPTTPPSSNDIELALIAATNDGVASADCVGPLPLPIFLLPGTPATDYVDEICIMAITQAFLSDISTMIYYGNTAFWTQPNDIVISFLGGSCVLKRSNIWGPWAWRSLFTVDTLRFTSFTPDTPPNVRMLPFMRPFKPTAKNRVLAPGSWPVTRNTVSFGLSPLMIGGEVLTIGGDVLYA